VSAAARRVAALAALALVLGACAGRRLVDGTYRAPAGYRVTVPGPAWVVVAGDSRADLELQHRWAAAGMLVNAACDPAVARRGTDLLARQLLLGIRDRVTLEQGEVPVNGRLASHRVLEARMRQSEQRVRIESYTLTDERCVYDLLYVATPQVFDDWRADFRRFVDSFVVE
jgi:hypothetical protein